MSILVMKFGGTSVADLNKMRNVVSKVTTEVRNGNNIIIAQINIEPVTFSFFFLLIFNVKTPPTT